MQWSRSTARSLRECEVNMVLPYRESTLSFVLLYRSSKSAPGSYLFLRCLLLERTHLHKVRVKIPFTAFLVLENIIKIVVTLHGLWWKLVTFVGENKLLGAGRYVEFFTNFRDPIKHWISIYKENRWVNIQEDCHFYSKTLYPIPVRTRSCFDVHTTSF